MGTITIQLSNGAVALVDEVDRERVHQHRWHQKDNGYVYTTVRINSWTMYKDGRRRRKGATLYLSRFLLNPGPKEVVDHANHDKLDNRRANLRICTPAENHINRRIVRRDNPTGVTGVRYRPPNPKRQNAWLAFIHLKGRIIRLGYFLTKSEAAYARQTAERKYYGEFAPVVRNLWERGPWKTPKS